MESLLRDVKRLLVRSIEKTQSLPAYRSLAARLNPHIRITEATEADVQAANSWFNPGEHRPQRHAPGVTNYVAKHRNRIVGFVQLVRRGPETGAHAGHWLFSLRVRLSYRGMGLGEVLCQRVIEQARAEGATELSLMVVEKNHAAISLYHKLGFAHKAVPNLDLELQRGEEALGVKRIVLSMSLTQTNRSTSSGDAHVVTR